MAHPRNTLSFVRLSMCQICNSMRLAMSGGGARLAGSCGSSGSPRTKGRTFTITLESSRDICKLRIAPPVSIDGSRAVLARSTLLRRRPVSQSSEPVPALSASVQMR